MADAFVEYLEEKIGEEKKKRDDQNGGNDQWWLHENKRHLYIEILIQYNQLSEIRPNRDYMEDVSGLDKMWAIKERRTNQPKINNCKMVR
jgi:hypothetical protein